MLEHGSSTKRVIYVILFALVCFSAGFMLATNWDMPARLTAGASQSNSGDATTPTHKTPVVDSEGHSPFVSVAEALKPTVVNITVEKNIKDQIGIPFDIFDWGPFFNEPPKGRERKPRMPNITAGGSGIIVDKDGYILTNNHVISDASEIKVKFADKTTCIAKVVGRDPETDVALLKVDTKITDDMVAKMGDSDDIRIGDWAIAIGNPFGLDWTVTVGVISARGRSNLNISGNEGPSYQDFIQTDASINYGNSGGPLVNIKGEVIGINTAINAQGQGIGFAIPINLARKVMSQLLTSGEVKRGYLGIVPGELDEMKREALGLEPNQKGVFVEDVQVGTPADKGGLKGGDVIIKMDGKPVEDVSDFRFRVADHPPGSELKMTILRNGKEMSMEFKLADRKEFLNLAKAPALKGGQYWLGIEVAPTDSRMGREWGVDELKGVLVVSVQADSPADGLIEPGDVIVEVGAQEIESVEDYNKVVESLKDRKKAIPFWVVRNGKRTFIPIKPAQ